MATAHWTGWLRRFGRDRMAEPRDFESLSRALLSEKGEASGVALASHLLASYSALPDDAARRAFFDMLLTRFGPDLEALLGAIAEFQRHPGGAAAIRLHEAAEAPRQELVRRMNLAPGGTLRLVRMREDLLQAMRSEPALAPVDADFRHLFGSWFNRGFLVLKPIDWATPAHVLEKIIRYEAVHAISSWDDLRLRIEPADRRCFAFFHPALDSEPLIFVEVALTRELPAAIGPLLESARRIVAPKRATTAVFYSISNCQGGLRGVSFGSFLIKQVVEDLKRDLPSLETFATLSPLPGFVRWLAANLQEAEGTIPVGDRRMLRALEADGWHERPSRTLRAALTRAAVRYLFDAKDGAGKPLDPVARFHLGNGARLERLNWLGDVSSKGLSTGAGFMVNYLYDLESIERNHEAFARAGEIIASSALRRLRPRVD